MQDKVFILVTLGELGGAQKYVQDIVGGLKDSYDITIGSGVETGDQLLAWAKEQGIKTVQFPHLKRGLAFGTLPALSDFPFWLNLVRHLRKEKYDVVHLNSSKVGYLGALATFFAPGTKAVFTAHGWAFDDPTVGRKWLWVVVNKFGAYFLDRIIVLSEHDFDSALTHYIAPPRKLFTVYNGFDPKSVRFHSREKAREWLKEKTRIEPYQPVVGIIANSYHTKDLGTLVRAVSRIHNPEAHLVIIGGEGSQSHAELRQIATESDLIGRLHLLGPIENAAQYLRAFDVFAMSSVKEGFSLTLLEAMAAGLPIVATPAGGNYEALFDSHVHPKTAGIEVAKRSPKEMAEAIEQLLNSPEKAKKLGTNAKERLKAFSYDNMVKRTRWIYEL